MNDSVELQLTEREMEVLNILWSSDEPLGASEIVKNDPRLSINTVQVVLRNLLARKIIEISDIGYSRTVLCRRYKAVLSAESLVVRQFSSHIKNMRKHAPASALFAMLLNDGECNEKDILEMEEILQKKKKLLKDGN